MLRKIVITMFLVALILTQSAAIDESSKLRQEIARLEQEKRKVEEDIRKNSLLLLDPSVDLIKTVTDYTLLYVGIADGLGFATSIVSVSDGVTEMREHWEKRNYAEFSKSLLESTIETSAAVLPLIPSGIAKQHKIFKKVKETGELIEETKTGFDMVSGHTGTIVAAKSQTLSYAQVRETDNNLKRRLGGINRSIIAAKQRLAASPSTPPAKRNPLGREIEGLKKKQTVLEQQLNSGDAEKHNLDEAIALMAFSDLGDRSFRALEDFQRLARKYPEIERAYKAAFQSPQGSAESCAYVKTQDKHIEWIEGSILNAKEMLRKWPNDGTYRTILKRDSEDLEVQRRRREEIIQQHNKGEDLHRNGGCLRRN